VLRSGCELYMNIELTTNWNILSTKGVFRKSHTGPTYRHTLTENSKLYSYCG
jgi:hypothetical protein